MLKFINGCLVLAALLTTIAGSEESAWVQDEFVEELAENETIEFLSLTVAAPPQDTHVLDHESGYLISVEEEVGRLLDNEVLSPANQILN